MATHKIFDADGTYSIQDSAIGTKSIGWAPFEADAACEAGDGVVAFPIPASMNGMNLINVVATVTDKGVTGTMDVQIRRQRGAAEVDMLSTKVTVGDEYFAQDGVVNTSNDDVATGDQIFCDIDAIHSGTAADGCSVIAEFRLP